VVLRADGAGAGCLASGPGGPGGGAGAGTTVTSGELEGGAEGAVVRSRSMAGATPCSAAGRLEGWAAPVSAGAVKSNAETTIKAPRPNPTKAPVRAALLTVIHRIHRVLHRPPQASRRGHPPGISL
jgi:hypothetical protein